MSIKLTWFKYIFFVSYTILPVVKENIKLSSYIEARNMANISMSLDDFEIKTDNQITQLTV